MEDKKVMGRVLQLAKLSMMFFMAKPMNTISSFTNFLSMSPLIPKIVLNFKEEEYCSKFKYCFVKLMFFIKLVCSIIFQWFRDFLLVTFIFKSFSSFLWYCFAIMQFFSPVTYIIMLIFVLSLLWEDLN